MTTTPPALIDASINLKEENANTIETIVDEKQEKTVFKPVSGDGVGVNAWCGGVVSVLDSNHGEIQEEETGNDIIFPHVHTHIQPKSNVLIFHTSTVSMTTWLMSSLDDVMIGR